MYQFVFISSLIVGIGLLILSIITYYGDALIINDDIGTHSVKLHTVYFILSIYLLLKLSYLFIKKRKYSFDDVIVGTSLLFDLMLITSTIIIGYDLYAHANQTVTNSYFPSIQSGATFIILLFIINFFGLWGYMWAISPEQKPIEIWQEDILDVEE